MKNTCNQKRRLIDVTRNLTQQVAFLFFFKILVAFITKKVIKQQQKNQVHTIKIAVQRSHCRRQNTE